MGILVQATRVDTTTSLRLPPVKEVVAIPGIAGQFGDREENGFKGGVGRQKGACSGLW